jgi:ribosomal small subunit protein bTHX
MGKGDKKSKKGKRFQHSFGKTRARKKGLTISSRKKVVEKTKPVEHKKPIKPEAEFIKPVVVIEPKVEEFAITEPVIPVIKEEEVKLPEIKEAPIVEIPQIEIEPIEEEPKVVEPVHEAPKVEIKEEKKPAQEAPKKRGRPKKKKEE